MKKHRIHGRARLRHITESATERRLNHARATAAQQHLAAIPPPGQVTHLVLPASYNAYHLIPAILSLQGETCRYLRIFTLGFGAFTVSRLCGLLEAGSVLRLDLTCNIVMRTDSRRAHLDQMASALSTRRSRVVCARSHMKILLFDFPSGARIVASGSANMESCADIEFMAIENNPGLHDFYAEISDVLHDTGGDLSALK